MKISISAGNEKTGGIPSFNLPPIESCPNHKFCVDFRHKGKKWTCYAIQSMKQYKEVRAAWKRNFSLCKSNLADVERQLANHFKKTVCGYFRIHSSGDFYSLEYAAMWIRLAKRFPKVQFLAYTKMYGYFAQVLPDNFQVFASFMPGVPVEQAIKVASYYRLPLAYSYGITVPDIPDVPDGFRVLTCPDQVVKAQKKHPRLTCAQCKLCWEWEEKIPQNIILRFVVHR